MVLCAKGEKMKLGDLVKGKITAAAVDKPKENFQYVTIAGMEYYKDIPIEKGDIVKVRIGDKWKLNKPEIPHINKKRGRS